MRKLLLALALLLVPCSAWAQCTGVFNPNTLCGNLSGVSKPPAMFSATLSVFGPSSSTSGQIPTFGNNTGNQFVDPATITTSQALNFTGVLSASGADNFSNTVSINILNVTSQFFYLGALVTSPIPTLTNSPQVWTGANSFTQQLSANTFAIAGTALTLPVSATNGGTGVQTIPTHSVVLGEGTNPTSSAGPGTLGQCLVSQGAAADPLLIGGCRVLLSSVTVASTAALSSALTAGYNDYELAIENCIPVTNGVQLTLQNLIGGSAITSNYASNEFFSSNGSNWANTTSTATIPLGTTVAAAGIGWSGILHLFSLSSNQRMWQGQGSYNTGTSYTPTLISGTLSPNVAFNGYQIGFSSGNITSCTAKLYGIL